MENTSFVLNIVDKEKGISSLREQVLMEEIAALPEMPDNSIQITSLYIMDMGEELELNGIIRSTISRDVNLQIIPIVIQHKEENLGSDNVNFGFLGLLPPFSATPFTVKLDKSKYNLEGVELTECKAVFNSALQAYSSNKCKLQGMDEGFEVLEQRIFEELVEKHPPVRTVDVEVHPSDIYVKDSEAYFALTVYNGTPSEAELGNVRVEAMNVMKLPLAKKSIEKLPVKVAASSAYVFKIAFNKEDLYTDSFDNLRLCKIKLNV